MLKVSLFLIMLFCLLFVSLSYADNFIFSGYAKSYALGQGEVTIESVDSQEQDQIISTNFQSQSALRLMASYFSSSKGNVEFHYEVQPLYFSNTDFIVGSGGIGSTFSVANTQYRFKDLDPVLKDLSDNVVILQNIDRFNYQYSNEYGDFTIGRQVLSFGSSRFINPTDIFIPFTIQTLNQEYRVGIDAIRYKADVGDFALIDMGVIIGEDAKKQHSAAFLRGKNSINGNDIELMAIVLDDAWLIGGGIERALGGFGFWFETAYMSWNEQDKKALNNENILTAYSDNYWRTSIGSDYAINEDFILMFEYHHNGAGSKEPDKYNNLLLQAPYQKGGVFLLGQHYIIPAITWLVSPLMSVNASAFYNVSDNSVFFNISSETSWSDNLYSDFGVYLTAGENLQYQTNPDENQYTFGSEYGAYPLSIYASLRYYF